LVKKYTDEWNRAKDFLKAVRANIEIKDIKTVANREYFAMERAVVVALLIENKRAPKNHKEIWEMSRYLDLGINIHELMRRLYDLRLQADYGKISNIVELNEQNVKYYLDKIELIMKKIKEKYNIE